MKPEKSLAETSKIVIPQVSPEIAKQEWHNYQELKKAKNLKIILRKILYGKKLKFGSEVKWNNYLKIIKNYFYPIKKGGDK